MSKAILVAVGVAALILAAIAAAVCAFVVADGSMDMARWALATLTGAGAALCLALSFGRPGGHRPPTWATATAALSLAALLPLSCASSELRGRADVALLCAALVILLVGRAQRPWWQDVAAGVLVTVAAALDITSFILPLGVVLAAGFGGRASRPPPRPRASSSGVALDARPRRRSALQGFVLVAGAVIGQGIARLIGLPVFCAAHDATLVSGLHHDLLVLLPAVMLALGGWTSSPARKSGHGQPDWRSGWSTLSCLALIGVLAGLPFSVRLLVLPLWWWVPSGLTGLFGLCRGQTADTAVSRSVGYLACGLLIVLSYPSERQWRDSLLLMIYWLIGS